MAETNKPKEASKEGPMGFIIALVVVTLLAGGAGFGFATQFLTGEAPSKAAPKPEAAAKKKEGEAKADDHGGHGKTEEAPEKVELDVVPLAPIVTNLAKPSDMYVRLEGSLLVEKDVPDMKVLTAKVSEDVVALLRSLSLSEVQGAHGLGNLRDDINDRVRIRSEGKARELIINSLVME